VFALSLFVFLLIARRGLLAGTHRSPVTDIIFMGGVLAQYPGIAFLHKNELQANKCPCAAVQLTIQ
jgi:hypothetical protein